MSPEHSGDAIVHTRVGRGHTSTSRHKRKREKTGHLKRKRKHWEYFSRWDTGESDDEDDIDLYRWSKSKGLTSKSIPHTTDPPLSVSSSTTKRAKTHNGGLHSKNHVLIKASSFHSIPNHSMKTDDVTREEYNDTIDLIQEKTFLGKLCSNISDKKWFVELSKEARRPAKITPQKPLPNQPSPVVDFPKSVTNSDKIICDVSTIKHSPDRPVIYIPIAEDVNIEQEKESNNIGNSTILQPRQQSPKKCSPVNIHSSPAIIKRKWSANIETDLLRLYENGSSITARSSLVSSWAKPGTITSNSAQEMTSDMSLALDKKLERTEHTPGYVQALAKMFKCRLQMRREREQAIEKNPSQIHRTKITMEQTTNENRNSSRYTVSPTYLRYSHIEYNQPTPENDQHSHLTTGAADEFASFYPKNHRQYHHERVKSIRTQFGSRALLPELATANGEQYVWGDHSINRRQTYKDTQLDDKPRSGDGEFVFDAIKAKLEKEMVSTKNGAPNLKLGQCSPTLQKPTPMLMSKSDSAMPSSYGTLSRKTKQCLQSNLRTQLSNDNIAGKKLSKNHIGTNTAMQNNIVLEDICIKNTVQARWSTSIGSLYLRPPTKSYSKTSIQNA